MDRPRLSGRLLYESPSEPVADLLSLVKPKKVTTSCLSGECLSAFWH